MKKRVAAAALGAILLHLALLTGGAREAIAAHSLAHSGLMAAGAYLANLERLAADPALGCVFSAMNEAGLPVDAVALYASTYPMPGVEPAAVEVPA